MLDLLSNYMPVILAAVFMLMAASLIILFIFLLKQRDLKKTIQSLEEKQSRDALSSVSMLEERLRNELSRHQQAFITSSAENSRNTDQRLDILGTRLDVFEQSQEMRLHRIVTTLENRLDTGDQRADQLRTELTAGMEKLQRENSEKLEQMRMTVDEKLHDTLNRRLGESFSLVSERLELVYKGLGEMQTLANGVGDLKKVLTNVKTRGIWGEVQLGAILSQMLSPEQYAENVQVVPQSPERVEYAVLLPGANTSGPVYMPIDSKFPMEAYERLVAASEEGDPVRTNAAAAELNSAVVAEARRISKKYISPPYTTDFAVMFLATEGLYAEAMRIRGLMEEMQQHYHILIAGPSTLSALLNSLQVGFRTLAIEQRSAEVWQLLGTVKAEFSRFSELLDQTQQRLRQAGETIEKAAVRTRSITRRLRDVESLGSIPDPLPTRENTEAFSDIPSPDP